MKYYHIDKQVLGMLLQKQGQELEGEYTKFLNEQMSLATAVVYKFLQDKSLPENRINEYFEKSIKLLESNKLDENNNLPADVTEMFKLHDQGFDDVNKILDKEFENNLAEILNEQRKGYYVYASFRLSKEESDNLDKYLENYEKSTDEEVERLMGENNSEQPSTVTTGVDNLVKEQSTPAVVAEQPAVTEQVATEAQPTSEVTAESAPAASPAESTVSEPAPASAQTTPPAENSTPESPAPQAPQINMTSVQPK